MPYSRVQTSVKSDSCPAGYTVTCMLTDPCGGFAESTFNVTVRASDPAPTPRVTPNNLQAECVLVPKVYDWVVLASSYHSKIEIPSDCRLLVDAAILAGQQVTFTCLDQPIPAPSCQIIDMRRESIMVGGAFVRVGVVRFLFSAALPIGVFTDGIPLCQFSPAVQFEQEVVLCLPEPLGEANILCRTLAVECQSSGNVLLGGMLPVDVQLTIPCRRPHRDYSAPWFCFRHSVRRSIRFRAAIVRQRPTP